MKNLIKKCIPSTQLNVMIGHAIVFFSQFKSRHFLNRDVSALIAPPGGGNIGDQAMLESYLHNVAGKKLIITTNDNALVIPAHYALDTEVLNLPGLIYGQPHTFLRDFLKLTKLLPNLNSLYIIGADVMDGGYNPHASAMRAYVALFTAKLNVPSRVTGFSWNANPHKKAFKALKRAGDIGVKLLIRDPVSHQRLIDAKVSNAILSADIVFANHNQQDAGIEDILAFCEGKKVAIVNASGLIAKQLNQVEEYKTIIAKLQEEGYAIVLLPHVIRPGANDLEVCAEIASMYPDLYFVDRLLEPDQIKRLVHAANLVVTGRMHLSIMSINAGVPAIVLSTQGKVDGLMQFFSLPELSIEPQLGFGETVADLIDIVQGDYQKYITHLADNIGSVRGLSENNFN